MIKQAIDFHHRSHLLIDCKKSFGDWWWWWWW